jgi:adenylate kinase family enzyme
MARPDDSSAAIARRHEVWGIQARSIIGYYEQLGVAHTIPADVAVLEVVQRAVEALKA